MSQTSMRIRQRRGGVEIDQAGMLPQVSIYGGQQYLTTTAFLHFSYDDTAHGEHHLRETSIFSLPNGMLQDFYNPDFSDTIWQAGPDAPTLGEKFRVRASFKKLRSKAAWRVQTIRYDEASNKAVGTWSE